MDIKKTARNVWKYGTRLYVASWLAVSVHGGYDYFRYNLPRIEQRKTVQILEVHRYKVKVDGNEKYLTLAGEQHDYNLTEHEMAQELVNEHKHFANECGSDVLSKFSVSNFFYGLAMSVPITIISLYEHLGNGRGYDSISQVAEKMGHNVQALENPNDPLDNMSVGEKTQLLGILVFSALKAPLAYYEAKNEKPFDTRE